MKKILKELALFAGILLVSAVIGGAVFAWSEPSGTAPANNVSAPLNTSSTAQTKNGALNVTGNMGVGLSSPSQKLEVYGAGLFDWAGGSNGIVYLGDSNHGIKATSGSGVTIFSYGAPTGLFLQQSTGNIGIGTASPTARLEVAANNSIKVGNAYLSSGGDYVNLANNEWYNGSAWTVSAAGALLQMTGQTTNLYRHDSSGGHTLSLTVDSSGNVGIGTASPGAKLDVQGAFAANFGTTAQCCGGTSPTLSIAEATSSNNRLPWIQFHTSGYQEAYIRLAKDARVFEMGDNQSVGASLALLNGSGTRNIYITPTGGAYSSGGMRIGYQSFSSNSNGWLYMGNSSYGVYGGQGLAADNLWANTASYAGAFYYTSDEALKKNVNPLDGSLEKITKLNGVSFNWIESGEPSIGLIAQEVEKIYPEVVTTNTANGYKSVDYGKLVAPLIEAVKEQQKQITGLESRIDELEAKLEATEK